VLHVAETSLDFINLTVHELDWDCGLQYSHTHNTNVAAKNLGVSYPHSNV